MAKQALVEKKFVTAYINNGGNATAAYAEIKPTVSRRSAKQLGYEVANRPAVAKAIETAVKKVDVLSLEAIEARLAWALDMAKNKGDYTGLVEIDKFTAKLRGHLVDKSEVKTTNADAIPNSLITQELQRRAIPCDTSKG